MELRCPEIQGPFPWPKSQGCRTNTVKNGFTAAAINSALSPYLKVGFFTSSFPWKTRRMDRLCVRIAGKTICACWLQGLFLDRGPSLVSALEMGSLSPCHIFHPVLIYSCLREEGKVSYLSSHLLCKLLPLNLFSLVTVVQVCAPLSIMHGVKWEHSPSFCLQCSALSKGNSTKILNILFFSWPLKILRTQRHFKPFRNINMGSPQH